MFRQLRSEYVEAFERRRSIPAGLELRGFGKKPFCFRSQGEVKRRRRLVQALLLTQLLPLQLLLLLLLLC